MRDTSVPAAVEEFEAEGKQGMQELSELGLLVPLPLNAEGFYDASVTAPWLEAVFEERARGRVEGSHQRRHRYRRSRPDDVPVHDQVLQRIETELVV